MMKFDSEAMDIARWAHDGEVFGIAMFAALRDRCADSVRRSQLESLRLLEVRTRDLMATFISRRGADAIVQHATIERGHAGGVRLAAMPWDLVLDSFARAIDPILERYRRLFDIVAHEDHGSIDQLIDHEEAIRAYVEAARRRDPDPAREIHRLLSQAPLPPR